MFTDEDTDLIHELQTIDIPRWQSELSVILGHEIEITVDWDSTYTFAPALEPQFDVAGSMLVSAVQAACEVPDVLGRLRSLQTIRLVSVSPHHGYGFCVEGTELQYRTTVYPKFEGAEPTIEELSAQLQSASFEFADAGSDDFEENHPVVAIAQTVGDVLASAVSELSNQFDAMMAPMLEQQLRPIIDEADALNVDARDGEGNSPLHIAAQNGLDEITWLLTKRGADTEARNDLGDTPLLTAVRYGQEGTAVALLFAEVDAAVVDREGSNAVAVARANGHEYLAECIETQISDPSVLHLPSTILQLEALREGDATPSSPDEFGDAMGMLGDLFTMLGEAAAYSAEDQTPLHRAAHTGDVGRVHLQLTQGANPDAADSFGNTPLHLAVANGSAAIVELLRSAGARPDVANAKNRTACDWADWLTVPGFGVGGDCVASLEEWIEFLTIANLQEPRILDAVHAGFRAGGDEAVDRLIALIDGENLVHMELARQTLAALGASAIDPLLRYLDEGSDVQRLSVVKPLGELASESNRAGDVVKALESTLASTQESAGSTRPMALPALEDSPFAGHVTQESFADRMTRECCEAFGMLGAEAVDSLTKLLTHPSSDVQSLAFGALNNLGDAGAEAAASFAASLDPGSVDLGPIVDQLGDVAPGDEYLALFGSLAGRQREGVADKLGAWLERDPSAALVQLAIEYTTTDDMFVSLPAKRALESCAALPDSTLPAIVAAIRADSAPHGGLIALSKVNVDNNTAASIAERLAEIASDTDDYSTRDAAYTALEHLGPAASSASPRLIAVVEDQESMSREQAAAALGSIATTVEAVNALENLLNEQAMRASSGAARGLGRMGPYASKALPSLEAMADDFFSGDAAREAIDAIRAAS